MKKLINKLNNKLKVGAILTLFALGCSSSYQKINERIIDGDKVELYQSKKGEYKLIIKEPGKHILFPIVMPDAVIKTFYFEKNKNIKEEDISHRAFPLGEEYGYTKKIPEKDEKKAQDYLEQLLK